MGARITVEEADEPQPTGDEESGNVKDPRCGAHRHRGLGRAGAGPR